MDAETRKNAGRWQVASVALASTALAGVSPRRTPRPPTTRSGAVTSASMRARACVAGRGTRTVPAPNAIVTLGAGGRGAQTGAAPSPPAGLAPTGTPPYLRCMPHPALPTGAILEDQSAHAPRADGAAAALPTARP